MSAVRKRVDVLHRHLNSKQFARQARPLWNDMLRGVLCALMEKKVELWNAALQPQESIKTINVAALKEISDILSNSDPLFDEYVVLEKWAWMCTMLLKSRAIQAAAARQSDERLPELWRYAHTLNFLGQDVSNIQPFADLLSTESFDTLTTSYNLNENDRAVLARSAILDATSRRRSRRNEQLKAESKVPAVQESASSEEAPSTSSTSSSSLAPTVTPIVSLPVEDARETRMRTRAAKARTSQAELKKEQPIMTGESMGGAGGGGGGLLHTIKMEAELNTMHQPERETASVVGGERGEEEAAEEYNGQGESVWTKEMVDRMVEEIKIRRSFWDADHADYRSLTKRRDTVAEIADCMNKAYGTRLTERDITSKWNHMKDSFMRLVKKFCTQKERGCAPRGHFFEQMSFYLFRNRANGETRSPSCTPDGERMDDGPGDVPSTSSSSATVSMIEGTSKPVSLASLLLANAHNQSGDSGANATRMVNGRQTAALDGRSNGSAGTAASRKRPWNGGGLGPGIGLGEGGPGPKMPAAGTVASEDQDDSLEDSWESFGRLVERSGREMDRISPSLGIRMQRALHEVIYKYRLQAVNEAQRTT